MLVYDRIVIEIESDRFGVVPGDVVFCGIFPPRIERAVVVSVENLVVEPQTEACTAESVGPDLGVFAVTTHPAVVPLLCQMDGYTRMAPGERVIG